MISVSLADIVRKGLKAEDNLLLEYRVEHVKVFKVFIVVVVVLSVNIIGVSLLNEKERSVETFGRKHF